MPLMIDALKVIEICLSLGLVQKVKLILMQKVRDDVATRILRPTRLRLGEVIAPAVVVGMTAGDDCDKDGICVIVGGEVDGAVLG